MSKKEGKVSDTAKMEENQKNQKNASVKRFLVGLAGGVLGGLLVFGGAYSVMQHSSSTDDSTATNSAKTTKVSNVKYNVTSDTTKVVKKVQNAVVSVLNLQYTSTNSSGDLSSLFGSDDSSSSSSSTKKGELETASEGSGVIFKKSGDKAYIVTNNHVVEEANSVEIMLTSGEKVKAKVVGTDSYTDLAVLEISADKVTTVASFGDSSAINVGEPAIAIGSPLGSTYANSVTQGIISAKNRQITNTNEENQTVNINAIQTDAAINPGNSGGPLINAAGQVIGINSVKIAQSSSSSSVSVEGMGFAIPSNDVVKIVNQLMTDGKVTRPKLGISMYDLTNISADQQKSTLKLPSTVTEGVVLASVTKNSPAEKAGLKKYDVITQLDDTKVTSGTDLQSALYAKKVGDTVKVTYYRDGAKKTTTVTLTATQ